MSFTHRTHRTRRAIRWSLMGGLAVAGACATPGGGARSLQRAAGAEPRAAIAPGTSSRFVWAFRAAFITPIQQDQSVGASGALGNNVNEVVPIPGTDMIRVGAVQEGSLFQSNFRNAAGEVSTGSGSGSTLLFRITRP